MNGERWPTAHLDPIRRARVLAAALPGGFVETVLDVDYARAWEWLADLEHSVPAFDAQVDRLRITQRRPSADGLAEELVLTSTRLGVPIPFRARIEDGWCLMRARGRAFVVVMAAVPDGPERTRLAQLEAVPLPGGRFLRRRLTRDVRRDVEGIRRLLTPDPGGPSSV
jgi:hypothetical protein